MIYQATPTFNISRSRIVGGDGLPTDSFVQWLQVLITQAVRAIPTTSTFADIPVRTNYYGELAWITDSDTNVIGTVIAGGGTFAVIGMWDGTDWIVLGGAGTEGPPAPPDTSVQYNNNGRFGGSILFYDKTLQAFAVNGLPYDGALFYGEFISASVVDERIFATYLELANDGSGTAVSGYLLVSGGTHVGDAPAVCATEGFLDFNAGSAEYVKALLGALNLNGGTVSILANGTQSIVAVNGATVTDVNGLLAQVQLTSGTVTRSAGIKVDVPFGSAPLAAIPTEAYGLRIEDQTVAGMGDPDLNWAAFFNGNPSNFGIKATGIPCADGLDGVSGTFVAGAKTVTVTNGLITAIV